MDRLAPASEVLLSKHYALLQLKPFKVVECVGNMKTIQGQTTPYSRFYQLILGPLFGNPHELERTGTDTSTNKLSHRVKDSAIG